MPVKGIIPSIAEMLKNDWNPIQATSPQASNLAKSSGASRTIRYPLHINNNMIAITMPQPISPNSSPMIANIESFVASGKYPYA